MLRFHSNALRKPIDVQLLADFTDHDDVGRLQRLLYTLRQTARLNDVDPQAWLADVLARIAGHPIRSFDELLPWDWRRQPNAIAA